MSADFASRRLSPGSLGRWIEPGSTLFVCGGMGHPAALVDELDRAPEATAGTRVVWTQPAGFDRSPPRAPGATLEVFFASRQLSETAARVELVPTHYRRLVDHLETLEVDVALVQLAPPRDEEGGGCSYGLGVDFLPAVLERARRVIAQLNPALPSPPGAPTVELDRVDAWIEHTEAPPTLDLRTDPVSTAIGEHVAALIDDGACVQTGIGAIPAAVLRALGGHRRLGCHSGVISDGIVDLHERGALDNSGKEIDTGLTTAGFALGGERLYRWVGECRELRLRPVSYTHDPAVLARLSNLVAVNSAIEVDLTGQVCADSIGLRFYSGVGGQMDFIRGAALAEEGRAIIALPSAAAGGTISRIAATLAVGAGVVTSRAHVRTVVTEYGVAELFGRSIRQRAGELIAIAHPDFRDELTAEAQRLYHV